MEHKSPEQIEQELQERLARIETARENSGLPPSPELAPIAKVTEADEVIHAKLREWGVME